MLYFNVYTVSLFIIILLNFTKYKELIRIEWDKLSQLLTFLVVLFVLRLTIYNFQYSVLGYQVPMVPPELEDNKWMMGLVFWEDLAYGVPIYFINKLKKKWLKYLLIFAISLEFGLGHQYQGNFAVLVTALYPYFISYRYGSKYGFGTVMLGHTLYDFSTFYLVKLLPYLI